LTNLDDIETEYVEKLNCTFSPFQKNYQVISDSTEEHLHAEQFIDEMSNENLQCSSEEAFPALKSISILQREFYYLNRNCYMINISQFKFVGIVLNQVERNLSAKSIHFVERILLF